MMASRHCQVYFATSNFKPQTRKVPEKDRPDLQEAFVRYVLSLPLQRTDVASSGDVRGGVLKDLPGRSTHKPIVPPFPSPEPLFEGRDAFLKRLGEGLTRDGGGAAAIHGMGGVGKTRAACRHTDTRISKTRTSRRLARTRRSGTREEWTSSLLWPWSGPHPLSGVSGARPRAP